MIFAGLTRMLNQEILNRIKMMRRGRRRSVVRRGRLISSDERR